jgi:hypothetical protein
MLAVRAPSSSASHRAPRAVRVAAVAGSAVRGGVAPRPALAAVACAPIRRRPTSPAPTTRSVTAAAAAADGSVQGDMLSPSVFNKPAVRAASLAAALALSAGSSLAGGPAAATAAHVLAWATQFGTTAYTTFFAGELLLRAWRRRVELLVCVWLCLPCEKGGVGSWGGWRRGLGTSERKGRKNSSIHPIPSHPIPQNLTSTNHTHNKKNHATPH